MSAPALLTFTPGVPRASLLTGIYSLDDLMGRCRIDHESGCWLWAGCTTGRKIPFCRVPAGVLAPQALSLTVYRAAWAFTHKSLSSDTWVWRTCMRPECVNPRHLKAGTAAEHGAWQAQVGSQRGHTGRLMACLRSGLRLATSADVVREAESRLFGGERPDDVASSLGISVRMAYQIRRGEHLHQRMSTMGIGAVTPRPRRVLATEQQQPLPAPPKTAALPQRAGRPEHGVTALVKTVQDLGGRAAPDALGAALQVTRNRVLVLTNRAAERGLVQIARQGKRVIEVRA